MFPPVITRRQLSLALCGAALVRAQDEPVFTADARDVRVDTAVTRRQRPFRGLRAEDFRLLENGQLQPIRALTTEELPLDLVVIFYTSFDERGDERSIEATKARMLNGAANVLRHAHAEDRVALLTHTTPPSIELPFTSDREAIGAALRRMTSLELRGGYSNQLTMEYAVRMLAGLGAAPSRRRLIVQLGVTGASIPYANETVIRRLWSESIIYSYIDIDIATGDFNPGFRIPDDGPIGSSSTEPISPRYRSQNPFHIAHATGGDALVFLNPKEPPDLITPIRQRYVLWFRQPEGLEPGQARSISVELSPETRGRYPEAVVQARSGYITR